MHFTAALPKSQPGTWIGMLGRAESLLASVPKCLMVSRRRSGTSRSSRRR